jgi:hypothetical protein
MNEATPATRAHAMLARLLDCGSGAGGDVMRDLRSALWQVSAQRGPVLNEARGKVMAQESPVPTRALWCPNGCYAVPSSRSVVKRCAYISS